MFRASGAYIYGAHLGVSNLLPDLDFHKHGSGLKESPHSRDCFEGVWCWGWKVTIIGWELVNN